MTLLIKWKFRDTRSTGKNVMSSYTSYIENQVLDRLEQRLGFEDYNSIFTRELSEDEFIDRLLSTETEDKNLASPISSILYSRYKDDKETQSGLFSNIHSDIASLKESLSEHKGNVWIPIISLKESDSFKYLLESEDDWREKARDIIPLIANSLKIPEGNLNWMCGFHEKPPAMQNDNSDAASQPHLHFIIWEKEAISEKAKIPREELENLKDKISGVFGSDYSHALIEERLTPIQTAEELLSNNRKIKESCAQVAQTIKNYPEIYTLYELELYTRDLSRLIDRVEMGESLDEHLSAIFEDNQNSLKKITQELGNAHKTIDKLRESAEIICEKYNLTFEIIEYLKNNTDRVKQIVDRIEDNSWVGTDLDSKYSDGQINEKIKLVLDNIEVISDEGCSLENHIESVNIINSSIKEIVDFNLYKALEDVEALMDDSRIKDIGVTEIIKNSTISQLSDEGAIRTNIHNLTTYAAHLSTDKSEVLKAIRSLNDNQNLELNMYEIECDVDLAYLEHQNKGKNVSPFVLEKTLNNLGYSEITIDSEIGEGELWKKIGMSVEETLKLFYPESIKDHIEVSGELDICEIINQYNDNVVEYDDKQRGG